MTLDMRLGVAPSYAMRKRRRPSPIVVHREAAGLTQYGLAKRAGIQQSHLRKIEEEGTEPGIRLALRLADALGADVRQLFSDAA